MDCSRPPNRHARRLRTLAAVVLWPVLGAACDGNDASSRTADGADEAVIATTSTTGAAPTTSTTTLVSEAAVIDAYRRFDAALDAYGRETGAFNPEEFKARLGPVSTGGEYEHLFERMQLNRIKGWVYRGGDTDQLRPTVTEMTDTRAVIVDCGDDTGGIFDTKKNEFVEPVTPGARTRFEVVMVIEDGVWKASSVGGGEPCE
jgi:hypothetical protein